MSACSYSTILVPPIAAPGARQQHLRKLSKPTPWGMNMANEAEWLEDVRRWYFGGTPPETDGPESPACAGIDLGYEAAHPSLVARHWPDAPLPNAEPV